jgi:DNA-binding transcriptional MocR family regulator
MDLRLNVPPQPPQAALQDRTVSAIGTLQRRANFLDLLSYDSTAGSLEDRQAGALWLRSRLGSISAEDVLICAGGAALLVALVTTFAKPGDTIATEALTYPGIRAVCRHFGVSLVGVATDHEGIIPSALAEICQRIRPKILYCTPTIQNPTTATMSKYRRSEIATTAKQFDLTIFEDDAYGMLPRDAPPPIASIVPDRTYYMASLSKCISPGLRIAYCVGPEAGKARMTEGVRVVTLHAPRLIVAIASQWIEDGSALAILDAIRSECAARQTIARQILDGEKIEANPEGPHLWLSLSGEWKIPDLGTYLRANGVAAKGDGFAVDGAHPNALRIGLGAPRSREDLIQALEFLRDALRGQRMGVS